MAEELLNPQAHPKSLDAAQQQNPNPKGQLEGKKKRLLMIPKPNFLGFEIAKFEIIDETILLDSIPVNQKQSTRRASKKIHKNTVPVTVTKELVAATNSDEREKKKKKKKKYSPEMMEAVRFLNVPEQCKFWNRIYAALQSSFADDYDTLVVSNNNRRAFPLVPMKKSVLGAANGRCRYVNVFVH
jgi:hypothetical protein